MTEQPAPTIRQQVQAFLDWAEQDDSQAAIKREIETLTSEMEALRARRAAHGLSPQEREELEALEETISILSDPDEMEAIIESYRDYIDGNVIKGVEAIRALRPG